MSSHRRHLRLAALSITCCAFAAPSVASAANPGDTQADFPQPVAFGGARAGDTPVDFPGASRAARVEAPRTIAIVRPERTVVRDVDEVLPIVVSSAALLLALCGFGLVLVRSGVLRR